MRSRVNAQTEALTTRSVLFRAFFLRFLVQNRRKRIKITKKMQKYAKKFAYIKNLLYLCTRFRKRTKLSTLRGGGNTLNSAADL
jgi:hypothetical protein